ncbi:MAG: DUF4126 domain-containing protein [Methylacidiphilales bacterium]|nr:DUF4126 domain-containing protein [Candidatus Methylacidiphilales bacterium]MDW8348836.1 DUF4126 domain-containing protein [Verrucomicrobiae bacterium]
MESLELLAATLGLSALSGISLYLTVFLTGLLLSQGWITLSPGLEALEVLSNPLIITVAGVLYFIEFFADKVPWVDSLWDVLHSAIRPLGAVIISLAALGDLHPVAQILAVLICGGVATVTHLTKATGRLLTNIVPEPVSKIAVSVGEDVMVAGGTILALTHPLLLFLILILVMTGIVWFAPRLIRMGRAYLTFVFNKLSARDDLQPKPLDKNYPPAVWERIVQEFGPGAEIDWALRVFTGKGTVCGANHPGYIVGLRSPEFLFLWVPAQAKSKISAIPLEGLEFRVQRAFLFDEIQVLSRAEGSASVYRVRKGDYPQLVMLEKILCPHSTGSGAELQTT